MTLPERILWKRLQKDQLGVRFRRQYQFDQFILDFYCAFPKLAVEVDGAGHSLHQERDATRDAHLQEKGVSILRISANTIFQYPDAAVAMIETRIEELRQEAGNE